MYKKIFFYLFVGYSLVGFFVVPYFVKPQVVSGVQGATNAVIAIDDVGFNPYTAKLSLYGIGLSHDKELLLHLKSLSLNVEILSLLTGAVHVSELVLEKPQINLQLDNKKQLNVLKILKDTGQQKDSNEKSESSMPRIIVGNVEIVNGALHYEDFSKQTPFTYDIDDIGFRLQNIDTKNLSSSDATLKFYMKLSDGGFIDIKNKIQSLEPLVVDGELKYDAGRLYSKWKYVQELFEFEVADGKLYFDGKYHVELDNLDATTINDINIKLDNLRIKPKAKYKDILTLKNFYVRNANVKPFVGDIQVADVGLNSLNIIVKKDQEGGIDWLEYTRVNKQNLANESSKPSAQITHEKTIQWDGLIHKLSLNDINIAFEDNSVQPSVATNINGFNINLADVTLLGKKPFQYKGNFALNSKAKCNFSGEVVHSELDLRLGAECQSIDIAHYRPYIDSAAKQNLQTYDITLQSLFAGFKVDAALKQKDENFDIYVQNMDLSLDDLKINQKSNKKKIAEFQQFAINGLQLDNPNKEISIDLVELNGFEVHPKIMQDKTLNLQNIVVPKSISSAASVSVNPPKGDVKNANEKPFHIAVKKFAMKSAKVDFIDYSMQKRAKLLLDAMHFTLNNYDSKKNTWLNYSFYARVNKKGNIRANGSVRHTPLYQKGTIKAKNVSLTELNPYVDNFTHLKLDDGKVNFNLKTKYFQSKKNPDLHVNGSFSLNDMFINNTLENSSLLSFNELKLKEFTFEAMPNRFYADEIDLDSFYVHAYIDHNKTLNFTTLVKNKQSDTNASGSSQNESKKQTANSQEAFPLKIAKFNVKNGSAIFEDASLPIRFKTNIHSLNGSVYGISSDKNEITNVDISGEIDKYGATKLKGSLKSSNPKAFTDLGFSFTNLNLPSMSGYSSQFAGYKIDQGKLFLDLKYDIAESNLKGENKIVIKNIELGDELVVEDGGSLPLGLAIGLLEDSSGVIDIDMPVRGNMDEPDFKYGALLIKTLGNLIVKAVASPFKFLGASLGIDGEELGYVEFEAGLANILPSQKEKLDKVMELMQKRPKILLGVGAEFAQENDTKAIQKQKLLDLVAQKSGAKSKEEKINALTISLLEDIYEDKFDDDRLKKLENDLEEQFEGDEFDRKYREALLELCTEMQPVSNQELVSLGSSRQNAIKEYVAQSAKINSNRVKDLKTSQTTEVKENFVHSKLEVMMQ